MPKSLDNPCTPDCPDRNSTCHGSCRKYKLHVICNLILRAKRSKETDLKNHDVERFYRCLQRARKWRHR